MSKTHSSALVRAAAIAAMVQKDRVFVFSSTDASLLNAENASAVISQLPFATVHCAECTTEFATPKELASAELHCLVCGSSQVKEKQTAGEGDEAVDFPADEECVSLTCASCKTTHAMQRSVFAALDKEIACTICGTIVTAATESAAEEDDADDEFDDEEMASDDLEEVDLLGDNTPEPGPEVEAESLDPVADPVGNPGDLVAEETCDKPVMSTDDEELDVSLLDDLDDTAEASLLDFGTTLAIAANSTIVAKLEQSAAGDNKDLWGKDAFHTAIANHMKQHGVTATVTAFGFSPTKVKVKVAAQLAKVISTRVEAATADLQTKEQKLVASVKQSLDIATVGINKGFWKGVTNPLKAALVAELTTAGFQAPEKLVARVFDKHGLSYAATLLQQAQVVMARSEDSRNELAATLDMVNTVVSAEEDDEDSLDDDDAAVAHIRPVPVSETAKLLGGKPVTAANRPTSVISALLQSHGMKNDGSLFQS